MSMGRRRLWRRLRNIGLGLVALYGALYTLAWYMTEVPARRYVATCGPDMFDRVYVYGPYSEPFLHRLEEIMTRESFIYIREGQEIYVPYAGLSGPLVNDVLIYEGYDHFSLNVDWKIVSNIANGIEVNGVAVSPPKALADLIAATEAEYGPFPRRNAAGERIYGPDPRFHDSEDACAFMRAAILPGPDRPE